MPRPIHVIAKDIDNDWENINPPALAYLDAMHTLNTVDDKYGCEFGADIVLYFLSNAGTWRGEVARDIKNELKGMLK